MDPAPFEEEIDDDGGGKPCRAALHSEFRRDRFNRSPIPRWEARFETTGQG